MLPGMMGTEVCSSLRHSDKTRAIPVLMLTARGDEIDRVVGFEMGADDYIVKPFSMRELMLRIRAIMRRSSQDSGIAATARSRQGRLSSIAAATG
jgi:two-component system, OmpR family, phosphate regulon response regulator PhoB